MSHTPGGGSEEANDPKRMVVYLRFPFTRNGFQDPPSTDWDSSKEKALWEYLSKSSSEKEVDWEYLANKFNVPVAFILQQAAYLYEKELELVRAQMQRVKLGSPGAPPVNNSKGAASGSDDSSNAPPDPPNPPGNTSNNNNTDSGSSSPFFGDPERRAKQLLTESRAQYDGDAAADEELEPAFLPTKTSKHSKGNDHHNNNNTNLSSSNGNSSTFTDLSDTSISKSALEEALLNELGNEESTHDHH